MRRRADSAKTAHEKIMALVLAMDLDQAPALHDVNVRNGRKAETRPHPDVLLLLAFSFPQASTYIFLDNYCIAIPRHSFRSPFVS